MCSIILLLFFFSSRRRHTRFDCDWSSDVCSSDLGRKRGGALRSPIKGTETNGNKNFTFALPVAGLPGRGINASVSLVYNSSVWHKSTAPATGITWMTYDVDSSWPATGWRMTLGHIENQGSAGFTLIDPDGTRHALSLTSTSHYDTTDGTVIHTTPVDGFQASATRALLLQVPLAIPLTAGLIPRLGATLPCTRWPSTDASSLVKEN